MSVRARFHHIGITVGDLDRTLEFFRDAFGFEPAMTFAITAGEERTIALGLPPHRQRVALIPVGDVVLEFLEIRPTRRECDTRQDDIGYAYPCFEVDDLDDTYRRLVAKGYEFNSAPMVSHNDGPPAGSKFCILKDPDGKNIELMEVGPGLRSEALHAAAAAGGLTFAM
jgi:catechol 2,3-dioxygenase-like lactoylglutathione lyase family enzyme